MQKWLSKYALKQSRYIVGLKKNPYPIWRCCCWPRASLSEMAHLLKIAKGPVCDTKIQSCTFCECSKQIGSLQVGLFEIWGPHICLVELLIVQILPSKVLARQRSAETCSTSSSHGFALSLTCWTSHAVHDEHLTLTSATRDCYCTVG